MDKAWLNHFHEFTAQKDTRNATHKERRIEKAITKSTTSFCVDQSYKLAQELLAKTQGKNKKEVSSYIQLDKPLPLKFHGPVQSRATSSGHIHFLPEVIQTHISLSYSWRVTILPLLRSV